MARGTRCTAHRHDSLVAEENHHLQPLSRGGPSTPDNMRYLCANAHGDVHYFLDLIEDQATILAGKLTGEPSGATLMWPYDKIPWSIRRTYGPGVRDVAVAGWMRYADAFLRGDYRAHYAIWISSGEPRPDATGRPLTAVSYSTAVRLDVVQSSLSLAEYLPREV